MRKILLLVMAVLLMVPMHKVDAKIKETGNAVTVFTYTSETVVPVDDKFNAHLVFNSSITKKKEAEYPYFSLSIIFYPIDYAYMPDIYMPLAIYSYKLEGGEQKAGLSYTNSNGRPVYSSTLDGVRVEKVSETESIARSNYKTNKTYNQPAMSVVHVGIAPMPLPKGVPAKWGEYPITTSTGFADDVIAAMIDGNKNVRMAIPYTLDPKYRPETMQYFTITIPKEVISEWQQLSKFAEKHLSANNRKKGE